MARIQVSRLKTMKILTGWSNLKLSQKEIESYRRRRRLRNYVGESKASSKRREIL